MLSSIQDQPVDIIQQTFIHQEDRRQIDLQSKSQKSKTSTRKLVEKPEKLIEVLSDEEEEQIISEKFQEEVFRAKVQEAKLTKSKQTILKCLYIELNFRNKKDHEKENKFNSMVRMYISKNLKTSFGEPFDIRSSYFFNQMLPKSGQSFVQNEYLLYGCDLLPHKYIQKRFQFYGPSIKWIDASHCRLTFMSKIQGWDAVISSCRNFQYLKRYILANQKVELLMDKLQLQNDKEIQEQFESKYSEEYFKLQKFKKQYHVLKEFIELEPYFQLGFQRRLFIRNVTRSEQLIGYDLSIENKSQKSQQSVKPINQQSKKPESDYKKYLRVKQALWRQIQNSQFVKPQYEKIEKQLLRQKQTLWYNKRPAPNNQNKPSGRSYKNAHQNDPNYQPKGNFRKEYPQSGNNHENYSQKNSQHSSQYHQRNRSRDQFFQQRHNMRQQHPQRGRNLYGRGHNKFVYRTDQLQRAFDNYIERRDETRIIENPHKYLQPQFVDKKTGLHFYRNPFYNPPIQAQLSHQNYTYQQQQGEYESPAYDYGSQSINNTNLSGYQYDGNINPQQNFQNPRYEQDQSNIKPFYQEKSHKHHKKNKLGQQKQNSSTAQELFNKYCANRDNKIPQQAIKTKEIQSIKNNKKINNSQQDDSNQPLFEASDFSIITEQKYQNIQRDQNVIDQNLQNILDQIHEDQHSIISLKNEQKKATSLNKEQAIDVYENDDDSQDLQFMLRERENFFIKCETKQENNSKIIQNNQKGFIEQKIKEQHISNWLNSSPVVDDYGESQQVRNLAINVSNQFHGHPNLAETAGSFSKNYPTEDGRNMKKKVAVKKNRDTNSSRSKKSNNSLSKKVNN